MFHKKAYVPRCLCSSLMFQGRLCSTGLCSRGVLMFHGPGLCSTREPGETHQVPPGVAPGGPASEDFPVSRATGKILSPFGAPLMYSGWAYVPPKSLCSTTRLCSTLMFQGRLCSTGLCSRLGLMFHRPGLCSTERPGESSQMLKGVPPGETASDLFPVSRATRKILSPFGVPLMYRQ